VIRGTPIGSSGADYETQFLALPHLDERVFRRCSRLLYKICKARRILPSSYVVRPDFTQVGEFGWGGGFADVSKGEHRGRPVAIKHLRIGAKDEFDKIFKVSDHAWLGTSQSLSFNPATLSGSSRLEAVVSSKRLASAGGFCVPEPPIFPYHL